ncbi:MAG: HNH endonuclease [Candidatus Thermoplasmatota archaeon]|nr:HNH endonuclease [Candidatus Thermoplasmatota archaeon]
MGFGLFDDDRDERRTLGIREKQILYRNAKKRCQNPACGRRIDFDEMQVGHRTAWSKGGRTTLKNSVCLCYRCNKLQGKDSWAVFLRKQGVKDEKAELKNSLESLSLQQLKALAKKHNIKVKGRTEEYLFGSERKPPTKKQYISRLKGVVTEKEVKSMPKKAKSVKKKRKKRSSGFWDDFLGF